jgi:transmembrane sensor
MSAADQGDGLKHEAHAWLARLTSGHATSADAEAARLWCARSEAHARAFAEASLLWETLAPVARQMAAAPLAIVRRPPIGRRALLGGSLAAAAAAAGYLVMRPPLDLWPSAADLMANYRTGTGDQRHVAIDGGISVELNTRTSLNIRSRADEAPQIDLISGEVAIAIARSLATPLVVSAGPGRALATKGTFSVRSDAAAISVTCLEGTVEVECAGRAIRLAPRQQASYGHDDLIDHGIVDPAIVTAWRQGRLVFHGVPLAEVVAEINRYRPGRIILLNKALASRPVEATFPIHRTDDFVALVQKAYGAAVTALPGGSVLLS